MRDTNRILVLAAWLTLACGGGGESSGTGGATGSGGAGGAAGNPGCAKLDGDHAQLLETARSCNPVLSSPQCTLETPGDPTCGCTTFVSSDQSATVQKLNDIVAQYKALGCNAGIACKCAPPKSATCEPAATGAAGSCKDVY